MTWYFFSYYHSNYLVTYDIYIYVFYDIGSCTSNSCLASYPVALSTTSIRGK